MQILSHLVPVIHQYCLKRFEYEVPMKDDISADVPFRPGRAMLLKGQADIKWQLMPTLLSPLPFLFLPIRDSYSFRSLSPALVHVRLGAGFSAVEGAVDGVHLQHPPFLSASLHKDRTGRFLSSEHHLY